MTDAEVIFKMRDAYLAKAAADPTNDPVAAEAIRAHFDQTNATLRSLEKERAEAEPRQLEALLQFAARAYRRPLTQAERADLLAYYHQVRTQNQLSHEEALRDALTSVLMEPDFLYRLDISNGLQMASAGARSHADVAHTSTAIPAEPLSSYALASRLSYFLWASMPDEELLRHAAANDLQKPAVLLAQARRMMKDSRVRGLATEFTGNWLAFRLFETNNAVDRAALSPVQQRSARSHVPGTHPLRRRHHSEQSFRARPYLWQLHLREPGAGQALRHPRSRGRRRTTGCASTMPANMDGEVCCPCRYS